MKKDNIGSLLQRAGYGLLCAGLVACASSNVKPQKQAAGAASQEAKAQAARNQAQQAQARAAQKIIENGPSQLGEEVAVEGVTPIEAPRNVPEKRSIPTIEERSLKADINRMSPGDFVALGMDKDAAEKVVHYRQQTGPFQDVEELKKVPGVDLSWLERLQDRLSVG